MKRFIILAGAAALFLLATCKKDNAPQNNPPPATTKLSITDFSPQSGQPGTQITITGTGFGSDLSAVQVAIGNSPYNPPLSVSPTTIVIQTNSTQSGQISVLINGNKAISTNDFTGLEPDLQIVGYNTTGQLGHELYFSGVGFGSDTNKVTVSFGGTTPVKADYIATDKLAMGVTIPRYAQAGKVVVTVNGKSVTGSQPFSFTTSMRDFSPKSVTTGDTVKITGVAFTTISDMRVDFNTASGLEETPIKVTPTELWVIVPSYARTGNFRIIAQLSTLDDYSPVKFTFTPRVYFSNYNLPTSAKVNDIIVINGDFDGADISKMFVSFNGSVPINPISISGPNISVKIPADAKTGPITISETGYTSYTSPFTITITD